MNPVLIQLAIQELPTVIDTFRQLFKKHDPTAPEPTNEDVIAAFEQAFKSSLAKDDAWLSAH